MGFTTTDMLREIMDIKSDLKKEINAKGGLLTDKSTFSEYPQAIHDMPLLGYNGTTQYNWAPDPSWPDIESILENDATVDPDTGEPFPYSAIVLFRAEPTAVTGDDYKSPAGDYSHFSDQYDTATGNWRTDIDDSGNIIGEIVPSDKQHFFDVSKDIETSSGMNVRWELVYFKDVADTYKTFGTAYKSGGIWKFNSYKPSSGYPYVRFYPSNVASADIGLSNYNRLYAVFKGE